MAKRTIIVSDFSGKEVADGDLVTIMITGKDGRIGVVVADADRGDEVVRLIQKHGRKQARRGRKPGIRANDAASS